MPKFEEKTTIAAPAEEVFDLLANQERLVEWMPGLVSVRTTSRKRRGVGVTTEVLAKAAGQEHRGTGRCLAWDRPRHLLVEIKLENGLIAQSALDCSPNGAKTELKVRIDYELPGKGVSRFVGGLVGDAMARRDLKKALEQLKRRLESQQ